MAEANKASFSWPKGSWTMLKKMIRAWYAVEESGGEISQKQVAKIANLQQSQISVNKAFLQSVGIVQAEGIVLTSAGKNLGLGLYNENERVAQEGLKRIIRECAVLKELADIIRGRGIIDEKGFEAELALLTKQGKKNPGFSLGLTVLQEMLTDSGLVEQSSDHSLRSIKGEIANGGKEAATEERREITRIETSIPGLRKIPVPVSATSVWYVEVAENPGEGELEKFIEMQKLIFGSK